ncbi:MAG: SGNH/GDSL hydrolase family protein [Acidobacteria bacterium]|nr:SGNH/GDSL hydrolase family protein [Acidobacteriota bacterium]
MHWIRRRGTAVSILLAAPVTLLAFAICALAQVVTTPVTDTIYRADGTPAGGTVIVSWPAFTTPSGQSIGAGSTSAVIGAGGLLSVPLTPNAGAMPLGTYYTVVYHLDDGSVNREYWVVPASSSPVHISAIRSTVLPTSVAMQAVSKSYVDTAIAAAVAGHPLDTSNPYVLKAGDTMTGPLVLAGDPTAAPQAATKSYVDTAITAVASGISQKVSTLPFTTQTVAQPPATELQVNRMNGTRYASQFQSGRGDNGIANAASNGECASGCDIVAEQSYGSTETYTPSQWNDQTHVEDRRLGGRRDSYLNPENALTPGTETGQVINVTSTRGGAAVHQLSGNQVPASIGLAIDHVALTGGQNQFPEKIGAVPYFKTNYSALTVNGTYNTQGQHVLAPMATNCFGVGDCLIGSQFILASGGVRDSADEGAHPFDLQIREDSRVFAGTCALSCTTGASSVTVNATVDAGTQGDGRFLIDTNPAKVLTAGSLVGPGISAPNASVSFTGTSFPVSTFFSIAAAVPSQSNNLAPGTVTVAIATTGLPSGFASNTAAAPASSGVACISDPSVASGGIEDFETANYTVVDGTHLQFTLNKAHFANATVAIGGLCGYGLEQTVDTASRIRQVFPVIGSYSATGLYYSGGATEVAGLMDKTTGYANILLTVASAVRNGNVVTLTTAGNMNYDLNGLTVNVTGMTDSSYNGSFAVTTTGPNTLTYAQTGANSTSSGGSVSLLTGGYALYPMAEVLSVMNPATKLVDGTMQLAPNTVAWAAGDTVEQPHYHQQKVAADLEYVSQIAPRPDNYQQAGIQYEGNNGPGLHGWVIRNATPATSYFGNGGTHAAPDMAYFADGIWKRTMVAQAGEQSVFSIHCNSHGCGRWNSGYNLFELDSNAGVDTFSFQPQTSAFNMSLRGTGYSFTPQAFTAGTINAGTLNATTINGSVAASQLPVFHASGASHAPGAVPDPGATAGTTRYLREDGTWATPVGGGTTGSSVSVPQGATADYDFMQGSGSVLTDKSGNGNNGALGTGAAAPNWVSTGLHFPAGSNVALPAALNGTRTVVAAVYLDPLVNAPANTNWPAIMTSSMGSNGLNLMLFYSIGGDNYSLVFSPSVWSNGGSTTVGDARFSGFHIVAYVTGSTADSTVDQLYIDGNEVGGYRTQGRSAGAQSSGNLFLGASGAGYWTGGASETMYRVLTYASALTPEQVRSATAAVRSDIVTRGVAVAPPVTRPIAPQLHAIGDSITYGAGVSSPWPSLLSLTGQPAYTIRNWGISGIKAIEVNGTESNRAALSCRTSTGASSVAVLLLGTNDFGYGTRTAEEVFREIAGEIGTLKDAGCTVFVGTMLSRPGTDPNGNTGDVNKDNLDNMILQRAKLAGAAGVVDFAANPLLGADGANLGASFQGDHLHPTQTGQQMMATAASNTLNYYFGYTLTNANAVTASTYTLASGDGAVTAAITANAAWTMPDCTGPSGAEYTITNPQSAYTLTITGQPNQPINGLATPVTVPANATVTLHDVPNPKNVSGCHWAM